MADTTLYRAFTPDLEIMTRAKGGDGRTVYGIAVPYEHPIHVPSERVTEQFARGAFNAQLRAANRVFFARDHIPSGGSPIGRATLLRDDATGLYGEFRVSNTPLGEETLELIRDGVLDEMSVGFREGQNRKLPGGITERVTASLYEVAMVLQGAYGREAVAAGMRSREEGTPLRDAAQAMMDALPSLPPPG